MRKSCWADLRLLKEGMAEVREGSARSQIQNNSYGSTQQVSHALAPSVPTTGLGKI